MEVVYLKALGYAHQDIGRIASVSQQTLRRYLRSYQSGGIGALRELHFYRPESELAAHYDTLKAEFSARPAKSVNEARQRIAALTAIERSPTQIRLFLKRLGLRRRKVGQIPAKANPEKQQRFLEDELAPRLAEAQQGQRHVFFVDAAHFVMQPFLGFLWCLVRQFIQAPSGRQRFNVLGALHATTLQVVTFTNTTYINARSVAHLLCKLAVEFRDLPITLVLDNVRYQRCRFVMGLATALRIELLFLPPYSPNLNLIERLWKFVKKQCLYSEYYASFAEFQHAIVECLDNTDKQHQQALASLLTLNFQTF
jgi:transposase